MFKVTEERPGSWAYDEEFLVKPSCFVVSFLTAKELEEYSKTHREFSVETVRHDSHRSQHVGLASGMRLTREEERQTKRKLRKSTKG